MTITVTKKDNAIQRNTNSKRVFSQRNVNCTRVGFVHIHVHGQSCAQLLIKTEIEEKSEEIENRKMQSTHTNTHNTHSPVNTTIHQPIHACTYYGHTIGTCILCVLLYHWATDAAQLAEFKSPINISKQSKANLSVIFFNPCRLSGIYTHVHINSRLHTCTYVHVHGNTCV